MLVNVHGKASGSYVGFRNSWIQEQGSVIGTSSHSPQP